MIHKLRCSVSKFIRLIFNLNYRTSATNVIKENEIMSIEKLFKFETANFMYRHFNNLLPSVFGYIKSLHHPLLSNAGFWTPSTETLFSVSLFTISVKTIACIYGRRVPNCFFFFGSFRCSNRTLICCVTRLTS